MFNAWLKGIFSSVLIYIGVVLLFFGLLNFGEESYSGPLIIFGALMAIIGSYGKYVSKQSVRKASDISDDKKINPNKNLRECPACNSLISIKATSCIKCGEPF